MKTCPICGAQNLDDAVFCQECGSDLKGVVADNVAVTPIGSTKAMPKKLNANNVAGAGQTANNAPSQNTMQATVEAAANAVSSKGFHFEKWLATHKVAAILGGFAIVALVVGVTIGGIAINNAAVQEVQDNFEQAFQNQNAYSPQLPSPAYTNDTPYEIKSFKASDYKNNNGNVTETIEVQVANESFQVDGKYTATKTINNGQDAYTFKNVSSQATPLKGVDRITENNTSSNTSNKKSTTDQKSNASSNSSSTDEEKDVYKEPDSFESTLAADKKSCTASLKTNYDDMWFGSSVIESTYKFTFDGKAWKIQNTKNGPEEKQTTTYKDINGTYMGDNSDLQECTQSFTISDLNSEKGTFNFTCYAIPVFGGGHDRIGSWDKLYGPDVDMADVSSWRGKRATKTNISLTASISVVKPTKEAERKYAMPDGYLYKVSASGTTDQGSKTASLEGYLTVGEDGTNPALYAKSFKFDTKYDEKNSDTDISVLNKTVEVSGYLFKK